MAERKEAWWFPELGRSFKQVFVIQMLACYLLCFIIGNWWEPYNFMAFGLAFAVSTLKDCFMISVGIAQHRADEISRETQKRMAEQRAGFGGIEGRLLDPQMMDDSHIRPQTRHDDTMQFPVEDYGK
jgi:hypothetical protein